MFNDDHDELKKSKRYAVEYVRIIALCRVHVTVKQWVKIWGKGLNNRYLKSHERNCEFHFFVATEALRTRYLLETWETNLVLAESSEEKRLWVLVAMEDAFSLLKNVLQNQV